MQGTAEGPPEVVRGIAGPCFFPLSKGASRAQQQPGASLGEPPRCTMLLGTTFLRETRVRIPGGRDRAAKSKAVPPR